MIGKGLSFVQKFLNKKESRQQENIADFHTTIMRVDDNFVSSSAIVIDDPLVGNIYSLKELTVAGTAEVKGNVTSRTSIIIGKVYGDIISMDYAEIKKTAIISGNIRTRSISIEPGAIINGSISVETTIDDRELVEMVEKRLSLNGTREPAFLTFIPPAKETAPKPEARRNDVSKKNAVVPKSKPVKPIAPEKDSTPPIESGWY
jgi:cytoskeletal protein CcmA (bactofilin family)